MNDDQNHLYIHEQQILKIEVLQNCFIRLVGVERDILKHDKAVCHESKMEHHFKSRLHNSYGISNLFVVSKHDTLLREKVMYLLYTIIFSHSKRCPMQTKSRKHSRPIVFDMNHANVM